MIRLKSTLNIQRSVITATGSAASIPIVSFLYASKPFPKDTIRNMRIIVPAPVNTIETMPKKPTPEMSLELIKSSNEIFSDLSLADIKSSIGSNKGRLAMVNIR